MSVHVSWFVPVWKVRASHGAHVRFMDAVATACTNVPATHVVRWMVVACGVAVVVIVAVVVVVAVTMGGVALATAKACVVKGSAASRTG